MCIFVIIDLITGVFAAKKRGEPIKSKYMGGGIIKMLSYLTTILLSWTVEQVILTTSVLHIVNIVTGLIVLREFKSILENFADITGNKTFKKIWTRIEELTKKKK